MQDDHWTVGLCFADEDACLNERYNLSNITEVTGDKLETSAIVADLLGSLTFPNVTTMNCEELCNCLSCGHAQCSNQEDQDNCPGNGNGYICRCAISRSYPSFNLVLKDVLLNDAACRQCDI